MPDIKQKVALTSIAASGGLTLAKGVVGLLTGSLAILSEAAHSLIDLAATVMTYFAVRISGKPADEEHHYGHGKVESITALAETALLFVLSTVILVVVSYSTAPPPRERIADLTYKTAAVSPATEDDPSKRRVNIVASVLLAGIIGVLWIVFR